jgi:glutamate synthase (NADPH/NADH) large chain/glutamate synthase (ferredoxin)
LPNPRPLFAKAAKEFGYTGEPTDLGVGVFFLPEGVAANIKSFTESVLTRRNIQFVGWREVPVNPDELGNLARLTQPEITHLLVSRPADVNSDHFERLLYLVRREIEREFKDEAAFYIPTLSSRLISYKGLAMPATLRAFYSDLQDSDFQTGISLYHQRFSTNTFPAWPLGQPFRMICHNGEINTVRVTATG